MRKIISILVLSLIILSCQDKKSNPEAKEIALSESANYASYGAEIQKESPLSAKEALEKFNALKPGDSLNLKFTSSIESVCKKKGC